MVENQKFPYTKIQMILTEDTFEEKESFFNLFSDCVDDVSVSQYTERGGQLKDVDKKREKPMMLFLSKHNLPKGNPIHARPQRKPFFI